MPNVSCPLVAAILAKQELKALNDCLSVPIQIGRAVYGNYQDDEGDGTSIVADSVDTKLKAATKFTGTRDETAVWHFLVDPVHHFAVVPWHSAELGRRVYTVLMAYEQWYTLGDYIQKMTVQERRTTWEEGDLQAMLSDLFKSDEAWKKYFHAGVKAARKITYWKYENISLESATTNVARYS